VIRIAPHVTLEDAEVSFSFIRSSGPGGQNVNKVATAVVLRFDVRNSSLPEAIRERALQLLASRLTLQGVLIIKAGSYRTQERNKLDAVQRLQAMLQRAVKPPKKRRKTKPTFAAKQRRLDEKKQHSKTKALRRGKIDRDH
jgi:ribosome-associated protein